MIGPEDVYTVDMECVQGWDTPKWNCTPQDHKNPPFSS